MWLLLISCAPVNLVDPEDDGDFYDEAPVLEALDVECDADSGVWSFKFQTTGWTGGGRLYIARDSETVEQHKVTSSEASAKGSWDCLVKELDISEDWTLAQSGSSTRWLCSDQDALSFMIQVDDSQADTVADCAAWGAQSDLWEEVSGLDACTEFLQPTGQTTDTGSIAWQGECDG